ncbi:MAG: RHS repeat protein [Anaerolineae bacterium]|nr:RHS repeat protein [Anaerolineae bacterium]
MDDKATHFFGDYQYDDANRLTQVGGVSYTWDDAGNLTSESFKPDLIFFVIFVVENLFFQENHQLVVRKG